MSRFRRAIHSVASGYAILVATAIYFLCSVPLALHYLSVERFALWALMSTIAGYLSLIDLGMSGSVARLLIDYKDDWQGGTYGSLIKTGWLVLAVQGSIIFLAGFALAPALASLLAIQPGLQGEFVALLRWQSAALALSFLLRISSHLLQAHQRIDIFNYSQMLALALNFSSLWVFFRLRQGVFSLAWSTLLGSLGGGIFSLLACWQLELFPPRGAWGRPSWQRFKELFAYGKDMFLVAVGTQLILASQTMIITRRLGLEAATAWNVGTRAFNLVSQGLWRLFDVSGPAFSEMMARGERLLLRERYQAVVILTASLSAFAALTYALCNSLFVAVWTTNRRIDWPPANDVLLGVWMIVLAVSHCHNGFVGVTKKIGFMRYVYFIEGLVFVSAALLASGRGGLPAVIACSIVCSTLFSTAYCTWRVSRYFDLPLREVGLRWLAPMTRVLLLFGPVALAWWWGLEWVREPAVRLSLNALLGSSLGFYLFLRYGLSSAFQRELLQRAPRRVNPVLRRVFAVSAQ